MGPKSAAESMLPAEAAKLLTPRDRLEDGAAGEMADEANEDNSFLSGLTAWYNPRWHYENESERRAALDLIGSNHFSRNEPGTFTTQIWGAQRCLASR